MSEGINGQLIPMDFSKVNKPVAEYLRGEIKKKTRNKDGLHALLLAFQGIQFPRELSMITEKADVNFEDIKVRTHDNNIKLWIAIARLEVWFTAKRQSGHELGNEKTIKHKAATILANYV